MTPDKAITWTTLIFLAGLGSAGLARAQPSFQTLGSAEAPVVMTVYSDFQCPYCRSFALAVMPGLIAEFVEPGTLRVKFVHLPLQGIHENAVAAARAAHCAGRTGKFWPYHDYLFVRQPEWARGTATDSIWIEYAENLGLPPGPFRDCLYSEAAAEEVAGQLQRALSAGATGTPTVVVNGEIVVGLESYGQLRQRILDATRSQRAAGRG